MNSNIDDGTNGAKNAEGVNTDAKETGKPEETKADGKTTAAEEGTAGETKNASAAEGTKSDDKTAGTAEGAKADNKKSDSTEGDEDYKGKYEELSGKYREALCREFIAGENISSEFVRNAVARELSEQGFDLESTEGKESAKAFIEELRKSNPTIFENGKKPIVEFGKKDEGEEKSDKVSDYFYELNPGMKKRN